LLNAETKYIEVQLPSNICLDDPKYVRHVHLSYNEALPEFNGINRGLEQGITYSIGVNPFFIA